MRFIIARGTGGTVGTLLELLQILHGAEGVAGCYHIIGDGSLDDRRQRVAHGDSTPRRLARQGDPRRGGADAIVLASHGESNGVRIIREVRTAILTADARLRDEHPATRLCGLRFCRRQSEQAGERVALAILRTGRHGHVGLVFLLVTGFGALPSHHRLALRREERGGAIGQDEARGLMLNHGTLGIVILLTRDMIAESHVVVAHRELHRDLLTGSILETDKQLGSHVVHPRTLRLMHLIETVSTANPGRGDSELLGEVTEVGLESQWRGQQHLSAVVLDGIGSTGAVVTHRYHQFPVGRGDGILTSRSS